MVETPHEWSACDNRFATVAGNDVLPDLLLGRLPVDDVAEAQALLDKIEAYEALPFDVVWGNRSLYVADDADIYDFVAVNESLIARLPVGHTAIRVYFPFDGTAAQIRQAIIDEVNLPGAQFVIYTGHGSPNQWANEDLFNSYRFVGPGFESDVDQLTNVGRPTLVVVLNCSSGDFSKTNGALRIMGEDWLLHAGGGAVGFWASTGLTEPGPQQLLGEHFYDQLWVDGEGVLGDAIFSAKLRLMAQGSYDDVVDTWGLLGDPALSITSATPQTAQPNPTSNGSGSGNGLFKVPFFTLRPSCGLGSVPAPSPVPLALLLLTLALVRSRN
jgi:hypothetical protein